MPYFERKPWRDMVREPIDTDPAASGSDVNIVGIAQSVLSAETGPKHAVYGPFRCRKPLRPGERGAVVLNVAADDDSGPITLDLSPGNLRARSGQEIPSNMVHFEPAHLTIPPGQSRNFEVHVLVPRSAASGVYSGRLIGDGPEPVTFIVEFEVVETREA